MAGTMVHIVDDTDLQEVWETAFKVRIYAGKAREGRKTLDAIIERDTVIYSLTVNLRQIGYYKTLAEATDRYNQY